MNNPQLFQVLYVQIPRQVTGCQKTLKFLTFRIIVTFARALFELLHDIGQLELSKKTTQAIYASTLKTPRALDIDILAVMARAERNSPA
jgi:7,8-dihydro-6-hydroxymethylpterin-pyrophosphokinase